MQKCKIKLLRLIDRHSPVTMATLTRYVNMMMTDCYKGTRTKQFADDINSLADSKLVKRYIFEQPEKRGRNPQVFEITAKGKTVVEKDIEKNAAIRKKLK